jgi:glutamine synthetase
MADRHVIYKNGVKEIAYFQGKAVSFMAKWRADLAGNSCHIHGSLWDANTGRQAFSDGHAETPLFRQFLAGLLAAAADMTCFLAPYVNSYKRFQVGSFAPTNIVWSRDNRTAGFRVLGHGPATRVECRIGGADVNPYVAFAAFLAAGLHGIEQGLELQPEFRGDAYKSGQVPSVPRTLHEALERLDRSTILRQAMGDEVIDHYVHAARWEQAAFDRAVTDWELTRYLERA